MKNHQKILYMTLLAIFSSVAIILGLTPLGFPKIGVVEITLLIIPVTIGAIILGPKGGLILGFLFGLLSYLQALLGLSIFGQTLLQINHFLLIILCFIPRILMGLFTGLIYQGLKSKSDKVVINSIITSLCGALINTILFMSCLCLFYYNTEYITSIRESLNASNIVLFIILFVGVNGLVEIIVNVIITTSIIKPITIKMNIN